MNRKVKQVTLDTIVCKLKPRTKQSYQENSFKNRCVKVVQHRYTQTRDQCRTIVVSVNAGARARTAAGAQEKQK
eukprot:3535677-Amphidinium_carterae.1